MPGSILAGLALDATLTDGTQRSRLVDASNNVIGSQDNSGIRGLAVTQSGTHYYLSPGNSSTAQLAAGATFTGTIEYSANQQAISILCTSDQNMTLTLQQFIDAGGTRLISSLPFSVVAGQGFQRAVALGGNYYRVTCTNNGGSTTSGFEIDTALGTLQSQTQAGNLPCSISEVASGVTVPMRVIDQTASISLTTPTNSTSGSITGLSQASTVTIQLTGTFSATAQVQVMRDGSTWLNVTGSNLITNVATGAYVASGNLTATGMYRLNAAAGVAGVRLILTAWTSGTITGTIGVSAVPGMVSIEGTPAVTITSGTITTVSTVTTCSTVTTVGSVTAANLAAPGIIADLTSTALASGTTNSATITPTFGCSYVVGVVISAVSGTNPVLDLVVQESDDTATNWRDVYHFPRISATGNFRSPKLPLSGNRIRYVQTVGGTSTPTVTRVVNRLQCSDSVNVYRQAYDRAVSLTTLNATTSTLDVQGCSGVQLVINLGAATTAPTLALEASDDGGASWYVLGTILGVASSTVQLTVPGISPQLIRGRVSVVGATVTPGYVLIRGY
jgi:hypothetical protein